MALYKIAQRKLKTIKEKKIDLEKNIQGVVENNLE